MSTIVLTCRPPGAIGRTAAGRRVRVRRWFGVFSLIACPLLLVVYLGLYHGLGWVVGARALVGLYLLGWLPGYLVQRYLLRIPQATSFETLVSSLLLGTLLTPLIWYALCAAGAGAVFFPAMLVLGVIVPIAGARHRTGRSGSTPGITAADAGVLWLTLVMVVLWSGPIALVEVRGGRVFIMPYTDHIHHMVFVSELARGVPPKVLPYIAGAKKWAYHHMPEVWCDLIRRTTGTDARTAYFFLALPLRYVFVCLACYLALVRRFGRPAAMVGVFCLLAWVGLPDRVWFENPFPDLLFHSYPTGFGLTGVFLILYYVSFIRSGSCRVPLLLSSILSVFLMWYKANLAVAVIPAVVVVNLWVLLKRRDGRWLILCLAVQAGLFALRMVELHAADVRDALVVAPMAFLDWYWDMVGRMWWGSRWATDTFNHTVRPAVDGLPPLLRELTQYVVLMVRKFHLGLVVVPYLVFRCGFGRTRASVDPFDRLALLILAACFVGFAFAPVHKHLVWNLPKQMFFLVDALLLALMGPMVVDIIRRRIRSGALSTLGTSAVLVVVLLYNGVGLFGKVLPAVRGQGREVNPHLLACCRYVETSTPPDATVLHPMFRGPHHAPALIMQRRMVLGFGNVWRHFYDTERMMSELDAFYAGNDPTSASEVLRRYRVDYVIADRTLPERAGYEALLNPVFGSGEFGVFRVERNPLGPGG